MKKPYDHLPSTPWVYLFKTAGGKVLYVGKAKDLKKRVRQYFEGSPGVRKEDMIARSDKIDYITTRTEEEAILLENNLIKQYQPPFNTLLKGDTWYVYIKIWWGWAQNELTQAFPRVQITRYKEADWAIYIGPKPWKKDLSKTLQFLRMILKFRTCSNTVFNKGKVCLDYQWWLCGWWCAIKDPHKLEQAKKEYEEIVKTLKRFFEWDTKPIQDLLLEQINNAIWQQNFERAARLRDILFYIQKLGESYQTVVTHRPRSWWIFLVEQIQGKEQVFTILAWAKLFEGKVIDILKLKREQPIEEVLEDLQREFWELQKIELGKDKFVLFKSKDKLQKQIQQELVDFLAMQLEQIITASAFEKQNVMNVVLKNLQSQLGLKNLPYVVEAVDISHLSWWRASGSLVRLQAGLPTKKFYRRYKIHSPWGDDLQAIREVLTRRFVLSKSLNLPDLVVIDGGKTHLQQVLEILKKYPQFEEVLGKVDFVALAKGKARKTAWRLQWAREKIFVLSKNWEIKEFELDESPHFAVLQKARDEAHRFANAYREIRMRKEWQ